MSQSELLSEVPHQTGRPARRMGPFSSFAASFSGLSVMTGLFQMWFVGYSFGGPAFVWFWPIVFAGQMMVAVVFAEMAARFPYAGSAYQWAKLLGSRAWGWHTGWLYLVAQLVTLPAVVVAMQLTLPELWPGFALSQDFAKNAVLLGIIVLVVVTAINVAGVRVMSIVNNIGVVAEICSAVAVIVLFAVHVHRGPGVLFDTNGTGAGHSWGYFGAFLVAGFMALYNMYAFDTASTLAEETDNPQRNAPRAVIRSLLAAGSIGLVIIVMSLLVIPDLHAPGLSSVGLPYIIKNVLGTAIGDVLLVMVTIAILVCSLALQAWAARTVLAMGRDGELPAGALLSKVSKSQVPVVPTLVTAVAGLAILLINLDNPKAFNVIVALGIVLCYLAYLGVTLVGLRRRLHGWPHRDGSAAVNAGAVLYGVAMLVNMAWPRASFYGTEWYQRYAVVIFVPLITLAGSVYYFASRRPVAEQREPLVANEGAVS
jgi:urea carboxylase system permease